MLFVWPVKVQVRRSQARFHTCPARSRTIPPCHSNPAPEFENRFPFVEERIPHRSFSLPTCGDNVRAPELCAEISAIESGSPFSPETRSTKMSAVKAGALGCREEIDSGVRRETLPRSSAQGQRSGSPVRPQSPACQGSREEGLWPGLTGPSRKADARNTHCPWAAARCSRRIPAPQRRPWQYQEGSSC